MRTLLAACLLLACAGPAAAQRCAWRAKPDALIDEPLLVVRRWEVKDSRALRADEPGSARFSPIRAWTFEPETLPQLEAFRAWAAGRTDVDPYALLRRQHRLYERLGLADREKLRLVLSRNAGRVEPMSCLEALLFSEHQARFPVQGYTEFLAVVLAKGGRLRVYLLSSGETQGAAPHLSHVRAELDADRARGWTLELHLHNHPFNFENESGDIGGSLAPSGEARWGDIGTLLSLMREQGLREGAITNGFDTAYYGRQDLERLAR